MAKRRKSDRSDSDQRQRKVRIARPAGRPFQVRYFCQKENREIRVSVGSRDESDAQKLLAEIKAKLLLGLDVRPNTDKTCGPDMLWEHFREEYRKHHLSTLRDNSVCDIECRLDLAERIMKPKTLGDLGQPEVLLRLQTRLLNGEESRRKMPRSSHTVRGYIASVLAALNWAYELRWLPDRPQIKKIKTSKQKVMKGRPISEAEFRRMLDSTPDVVGPAAAASWRFILRGLWNSALRIDELMHVSWDKPGTIRPVWLTNKSPLLEIPASMQKNDTEQTIPLLPWFEDVLLEVEQEQRTGWVFSPASLQLKLGRGARHSRPKADWVARIISRIGKAAGIVVEEANAKTGRPEKYASAHDLRRSCGERLRNSGVPPLLICRVMRHSSWETTRRHYAPGDVQNEAETLRRILRDEDVAGQS
jgi:integrase